MNDDEMDKPKRKSTKKKKKVLKKKNKTIMNNVEEEDYEKEIKQFDDVDDNDFDEESEVM